MLKCHLFYNKPTLLMLLMLPLLTFAQKGTKIAYVQETEILKSLEDYQTEAKELDSLKQHYSKEISEKTQTLNQKLKTLLSDYELQEGDNLESVLAKLKEEDREKYTLLMEENKLLNERSKNYENILQIQYKQNIQPIFDKVNLIIKKYAKSNNIKIVHKLESMNVAYIDEGMDITSAILKELEKK